VNSNQNKPETNKKTPKTGIKKTTPLNGKKRCGKKQQQTKTTKHTIEFSNNTPARPRELTRGF
jgi:ribosome assembly protein YihI (activator of Der GTPase)